MLGGVDVSFSDVDFDVFALRARTWVLTPSRPTLVPCLPGSLRSLTLPTCTPTFVAAEAS
jgi:hypothetical protein